MSGSFQRLSLLALAIIARGLADQIGGNGIIAVFVGGLMVGPIVVRFGKQLVEFTEAKERLLDLSVCFVFGVLVLGAIQPSSLHVGLYTVLSLSVIRKFPVALSYSRAGSAREVWLR